VVVLSNKIKLYIVDIEEKTVSHLEELLYDNPQLGIKLIGNSHNFTSCVNDLSRAKEADVYLISAFLPDQMGIYLIEKLKKVNPNGKVIIMVSSATQNQADAAKEKGADEVILKPFLATTLIDAIYRLVPQEETTEEEEDDFYKGFDANDYTSNSTLSTDDHNPDDDIYESVDDDFLNDEYRTLLDDPTDSDKNPLLRTLETPQRTKPTPNKKVISPSSEPSEVESEYDEYQRKLEEQEHREKESAKRALFDLYAENPMNQKMYKSDEDFDEQKPNSLVVVSSVSGAGKTTLLTNVAVAIQKYSQYKPRICIVDFNLEFPSVFYKFDEEEMIRPRRNVFDIVEDKEILDEELVKQALATHEPTGIKVLYTPPDAIRDISIIDRNVISPLFEILRSMFDLVLVDTSSNLRSDSSSFPLTLSDKNIVLMEPDISLLLHTRKFISMLETVGTAIDEDITKKNVYVLNKDNSSKTGVHVDTAKGIIHNNPVRLVIPFDSTITKLANSCNFVAYSDSAPISREIKELARIVYPLEKGLSLSQKAFGNKNKGQKKGEKKAGRFGGKFLNSLFER